MGYHHKLINKIKTILLAKQSQPTIESNIKFFYLQVPYVEVLHKPTQKIINRINSLIGASYRARIAYKTTKSLNYFPNKDKVTEDLQSNVIYTYTCDQCTDHKTYVGETTRHFVTRVSEHTKGLPVLSEVSLHEHCAQRRNFKVVLRAHYTTIGEALVYNTVASHRRLNNYRPPYELQLFNYDDTT